MVGRGRDYFEDPVYKYIRYKNIRYFNTNGLFDSIDFLTSDGQNC